MKKHLLLIVIILTQTISFAQKQYPPEVQSILSKSKNKTELEKFLNSYTSDSLKYKTACFLVANMDIQGSQSYYWADTFSHRIQFNEIAYPTFAASLSAFDSLKKTVNKIHPVPYYYNDADTLTAVYLTSNLNNAFQLWQQPFAKNISFDDFCEYLLPYRISIEPVQDWRNTYTQRFMPIAKNYPQTDSTLKYLKRDLSKWFTCTYHLEIRADPLPRLGALQLLLRKKGLCEDVAALGVFSLRSIGIPATIDYVPAWATSSGNHTLNTAFNPAGKPIHYDILYGEDSIYDFIREPAKVIRTCYSKQKNTLAYTENINNIPEGFMQKTNYKDVTAEYWQVQDVSCSLFEKLPGQKIVYTAVFNYSEWVPVWWSSVQNKAAIFTNMCKGAVFLPMYYVKGKMRPAGYPVAVGYKNTKTIIADTINTVSLTIKEQEHYLRYRPGKKYKLYYWNNRQWALVAGKITGDKDTELTYEKVPRNALYVLVPEYTQHKERPFTFNEQGEREWW